MPKLIISYRRSDSDAIAGRIRDNLAAHYGEDAIFIDVDNIPLGADFREHIREAFQQHDLLVAVIGPKWLGRRKGGHPRIHEETDPVRVEIEMALSRNMPLIPVLVNRASMPPPEDLPEALKPLSYRNAAEVDTGRDFRQHMDRLIQSMDEMLKSQGVKFDAGQSAMHTSRADKTNTTVPDIRSGPNIWATFAFTYVTLIIAYWLVGVFFDLRLINLSLAMIVVSAFFGFFCRETDRDTLSGKLSLGFVIAIAAVATMVGFVAVMDQVSFMPKDLYEWRDYGLVAASIAFAFWAGAIVRQKAELDPARALRALLVRIKDFARAQIHWLLAGAAALISLATGLWQFFLK